MLVFQLALLEEIKDFKKVFKNFNIHNSYGRKYYLFENEFKKNFVLVFSGVGKTNSASCVTDIIRSFTPTKIINIGLCGSSTETIKELSVCLVNDCYYLDVDATAFGYKLGQIPREDFCFKTSINLNEQIKSIFTKEKIDYVTTNLGSSDTFIDKTNYLKFENNVFDKVSIFDMEGTSFCHVCQKMDFECSIIKIVSDCFLNMNLSKNQFNANLEKCAQIVLNIVKTISNYLSN